MSDREMARLSASYVLDWLRQTNAPGNVIALQTSVVEALGGYASFEERVGLRANWLRRREPA